MDYTDGMDMDALASKLKELKQKKHPSVVDLYDIEPSESDRCDSLA